MRRSQSSVQCFVGLEVACLVLVIENCLGSSLHRQLICSLLLLEEFSPLLQAATGVELMEIEHGARYVDWELYWTCRRR